MKKVLFTCTILIISLGAKAQIDLSINPLGILFSNFDISAEYRASSDIGIELSPGISFHKYDFDGDEWKSNGFNVRLIGKYYFSPEDGCDKWNIGPYIKYGSSVYKYTPDGGSEEKVTSTRFAVGFFTGYKWVSQKNIIFEIGLGLGRAFVNKYESDDESVNVDDFAAILNLDVTGKLAVGYRFGGGK